MGVGGGRNAASRDLAIEAAAAMGASDILAEDDTDAHRNHNHAAYGRGSREPHPQGLGAVLKEVPILRASVALLRFQLMWLGAY